MSDGIADGHEYFKGRSLTGDNRAFAPPASERQRKPTGAELIAVERQRQIDVEGWTPEHDDEHSLAEIAVAGLSYVSIAASQVRLREGCMLAALPIYWPWSAEWWKPSNDPTRNLVKAGALIAAEIDRLQRAAQQQQR